MTRKHVKPVACDAALAGLSVLYLAFAYGAVEYRIPHIVTCPLLLITGIPCPLCGSTRRIGEFLHGAFDLGPGAIPSLLWLAAIVCVAVLSVTRLAGYCRRRRRSA